MPIVDINQVTDVQVVQLAQAECNRNGYSIVNIKKAEHEGDKHIRYVIAHSDKEEQFAVWLFNVQMGGLYHGGYHSHYKMSGQTREQAREFANQDFNQRK